MKHAAVRLATVLVFASKFALAQTPDDLAARLRACSLMKGGERLECLDKLSRTVMPPHHAEPGGDNWIVSQTTSPVDYAPIAAATAPSRDGTAGSTMLLSIRCRGGSTQLIVAPSAASGRGGDYLISYRVNDKEPVQIAGAAPAFGTGVAFTGDVVRLLQSLPAEGDLTIRLSQRAGTTYDGSFSLTGLETVRRKMAVACKWPVAFARPTD